MLFPAQLDNLNLRFSEHTHLRQREGGEMEAVGMCVFSVGSTAGQELRRKSESSSFKDHLCNRGLSLHEH